MFLALTGALQLFDLHESHGDYRPIGFVAKLGMPHKKQTFAEPRQRTRPSTPATNGAAQAEAPTPARQADASISTTLVLKILLLDRRSRAGVNRSLGTVDRTALQPERAARGAAVCRRHCRTDRARPDLNERTAIYVTQSARRHVISATPPPDAAALINVSPFGASNRAPRVCVVPIQFGSVAPVIAKIRDVPASSAA